MSNIYDGSPATTGAAVTPSDTAMLPGGTARALYVGTSGNIACVMADGVSVTFTNVPVGVIPIKVRQVKATGTTASGIVALY